MGPRRAAAVGLLLAGCANEARTFGAFEVERVGRGFAVRARADGRVLLESAADAEGPYAPVAVGEGRARVEMKYGAFRFDEGGTAWAPIARARWADDARLAFEDERGAAVAWLVPTSPEDGVLALGLVAADSGKNRLGLAFSCAASDRFLGFGAQADALDHRGHKVAVWTSEPGIGKSSSDEPGELWFLEGTRHASSFGLPTWLSNRGFVGVLQSDARTVFELCSARDDAWRVETWANSTALYLYDGPAPADALERATAGLLGRPMSPPPIAFAPWNDALFGSARVREVAKLLRDNQIPSSVLWTEDFRGGERLASSGYRLLEEWSLDRGLYPDAEALAAELRAQGFIWMAYFNTFLVEGTAATAAALAGGHAVRDASGAPYLFSGAVFKPTGLLDLSSPAAREFMHGYFQAALELGFDGWMADFGEWLPHDAKLASGERADLAHNRYPAWWMALNKEAQARRAADGRQRVFFARAGWLGSTRDTPVVWPGDQRTSFQKDDGLYTVVPMGLGLGLAGVSTFGSDIGGYQSATNAPATKELFFRWTSLGALSPVMRTHHGTQPDLQWWFGKDAETLAHYKRWAVFHLQLFPYLDGCTRVAEERGLPLLRALALSYPEAPEAWAAADSYLFGPALFVAPVLEEGATARTAWLPPGTWWPLFGGPAREGGATVTVPAPLTDLPAFARAGSVLPLLPAGVQTLLPTPAAAGAEAAREAWAFAGGGSEFSERDGTTWTLERGAFSAEAREAGAALPACTSASMRGCQQAEGGRVRYRLSGQGPLEVGGHRLGYAGPARVLDVVWQAE